MPPLTRLYWVCHALNSRMNVFLLCRDLYQSVKMIIFWPIAIILKFIFLFCTLSMEISMVSLPMKETGCSTRVEKPAMMRQLRRVELPWPVSFNSCNQQLNIHFHFLYNTCVPFPADHLCPSEVEASLFQTCTEHDSVTNGSQSQQVMPSQLMLESKIDHCSETTQFAF